jgi:hypothetical protein
VRSLNFAHPLPATWNSPWLSSSDAGKPTPVSLRSHLLQLLDAERLTVRSLVVVVSGRVRHAEGAVELSFLLGGSFTNCNLMTDFRKALPRARWPRAHQ